MKIFIDTKDSIGEQEKEADSGVILGDPALADADYNPIKINLETGELSGEPVYKVYADVRFTPDDIAEVEKSVKVSKSDLSAEK